MPTASLARGEYCNTPVKVCSLDFSSFYQASLANCSFGAGGCAAGVRREAETARVKIMVLPRLRGVTHILCRAGAEGNRPQPAGAESDGLRPVVNQGLYR